MGWRDDLGLVAWDGGGGLAGDVLGTNAGCAFECEGWMEDCIGCGMGWDGMGLPEFSMLYHLLGWWVLRWRWL